MRIAAVLPAYPPERPVGAYLATHELLTALAARGHDVHVQARAVSTRYDLDGVHVTPDPVDGDVTIGHAGDPYARSTRVRMVHGWGDIADDALAGAELVVFNSHATKTEAGHDGIVIRPPCRPIDCTPGDLVTLVNLSWPKGGELFWRLARGAPARRFLGVTGGWGHQVRGFERNVTVSGPVGNIAHVLELTRVLLMPSERESWGRIGVEAFSCGIPVIAHPTPGLHESLGDAAIYVDREDGQGWLDALDALDDPETWDDASRQARERFDDLHLERDVDRFVHALEGLEGADNGDEQADCQPHEVLGVGEGRRRQGREGREVDGEPAEEEVVPARDDAS